MAYLLQGKNNIYETDEVFPVIEAAQRMSGRMYGDDAAMDVKFRVVADHVRSALMIMSDGVRPGQQRPRLRAAPPAAPHRQGDAHARRDRSGAADAVPGVQGRDGAELPRAGADLP